MYAVEDLLEEAAYLAFHLHWTLDDVLGLEHPLREYIVTEVNRLAYGSQG